MVLFPGSFSISASWTISCTLLCRRTLLHLCNSSPSRFWNRGFSRQEPPSDIQDLKREIFMKLCRFLTHRFSFLVLSIAALGILPSVLPAQEVSSVVGTVADKSGGAIQGVQV